MSSERVFANSLLRQSGQLWKLYVLGAGASLSLVLFVVFIAALRSESANLILYYTGFMVLTSVSFVWFFRSVRCPRCRHRSAWWVVRRAKANAWLTALLVLRACPECGWPEPITETTTPGRSMRRTVLE